MTQFSSLYGEKLHQELHSDDVTVLFTTARRKKAINEAQTQWADLTECFQRQALFSVTSTASEVDLNTSTDFVRLSKEQIVFLYTDASSEVTILTGDDLKRREIEWLNVYRPGWRSAVPSTSMQLPDVYYEREEDENRWLGLTPPPSSGSSASMQLIVPYVASPAPLTSDTQEPFATATGYRTDLRPYHQGLVHYAASILEKYRPDPDASDAQLQKFLGYVARYLSSKRVKNGGVVSMARDYFRRRESLQAEDPRR